MKRLNERGEMPREQIIYPDLTRKVTETALRGQTADAGEPVSDFGPWNDPALHVSWLAGADNHVPVFGDGTGHVQLGLEVDLEYLRFAASSPNGITEDRTIMYTSTLSLAELDRLITVLKRARRKAFPPRD